MAGSQCVDQPDRKPFNSGRSVHRVSTNGFHVACRLCVAFLQPLPSLCLSLSSVLTVLKACRPSSLGRNFGLASMAGAGRNGISHGARPPSTMAQRGTPIALASERHRRRLFDTIGRRHADLPDEQPGHGKRVRAGSLNSGWKASLDNARRQRRQPDQDPPTRRLAPPRPLTESSIYALGSDGDLVCLETDEWQAALAEKPPQGIRRPSLAPGPHRRVSAGRW